MKKITIVSIIMMILYSSNSYALCEGISKLNSWIAKNENQTIEIKNIKSDESIGKITHYGVQCNFNAIHFYEHSCVGFILIVPEDKSPQICYEEFHDIFIWAIEERELQLCSKMNDNGGCIKFSLVE